MNIGTKGNIHLTGSVSTDTLQASSGKIVKRIIIKLAPASLFEGKGTEAEPYLIKNKADLMLLASATTKNQLSFEGTYFKVTNDIDIERDPESVSTTLAPTVLLVFSMVMDIKSPTCISTSANLLTMAPCQPTSAQNTLRSWVFLKK